MLAAELDRRFGQAEAERAHDIALSAGGIEIGFEVTATGWLISAVYASVCDATRVTVEMAHAVASSQRAANVPLVGLRIVLCTVDEDRSGPQSRDAALAHARRLLAKTRSGQILVTAPAAVVAGPTLPPGIGLLDQGLWTPAPGAEPERIYRMSIGGSSADGVATSNLGWARRAVHGSAGEQTAEGEAQLETVRRVWRNAVDGGAGMVLVSGGSPVSKTAFTAELALRLHAEGALVLYGRWEERARVPYRAFQEALGFYASASSTEQLVVDLEGWADVVARLLPEVATRVGGSHLAQFDSSAERARVFEALGTWVLAITKRAPTVIVLDDVHWAESTSVLLLAHLWHICLRHRLMLVVTGEARRGNAVDRLADLASHIDADAFERIRLA